MDKLIEKTNLEEINTEDFSFDGYQYVKGTFFAHLFEPTLSFSDEKVTVNNACIRKLPNTDYVQFLVNPDEKKLAIKPCSEEDKDSFKWCGVTKEGNRKPRIISCHIFYEKVFKLMCWDKYSRYRVLGKLIRYNDELIFIFDLKDAEEKKKKSKPKEIEADTNSTNIEAVDATNYGLSAKEHKQMELIKFYEEQSVFTINKDEEGKVELNESEETKD